MKATDSANERVLDILDELDAVSDVPLRVSCSNEVLRYSTNGKSYLTMRLKHGRFRQRSPSSTLYARNNHDIHLCSGACINMYYCIIIDNKSNPIVVLCNIYSFLP